MNCFLIVAANSKDNLQVIQEFRTVVNTFLCFMSFLVSRASEMDVVEIEIQNVRSLDTPNDKQYLLSLYFTRS